MKRASRVDYDYPIEVWNAALTVKRGTFNVLAFDAIYAKTITADALPAGTIATDVIVHQNAVTVGSLFGIKYHQSNATTGTWLGRVARRFGGFTEFGCRSSFR